MGENGQVSDLIDTTEMYLRTIYELVEEDIVPLRARIAERLHQSGPTVSQTVARMERDGLLTVEGDRHLEFTDEGRRLATRVMRKHRLAERLLTDVIGLDWELVHEEACRWEHVMSETVERRLVELLDHPTESPYGNPIPGLKELGETEVGEEFMAGVEPLSKVATEDEGRVLVRRISEEMQKDELLMSALRRVGALPDKTITAVSTSEGVLVGSGGETAEIEPEAADHIFVRRARDPDSRGSGGEATSPSRQELAAPHLELVRRQVVAPGRAAVDDHHRDPGAGGAADEAEAAHHGQRGAGHQQRAARLRQSVDGGVAALDAGRGHVLAEEHHVGLEHPAAVGARRHGEGAGVVEVDVAVGTDLGRGVPLGEPRVQRRQPRLQRRPRRRHPAVEADDVRDPAVQGDQAPGSGRLVQAVDVLGDQQLRVESRPARGDRRSAPRGPSVTSRGGCAPSSAAARPDPRRTPGRSSASAPAIPGRGSRGCRSRWTARRR